VAARANDDDDDEAGPLVGRGGLKLEAALDRFGLSPRLRGARAVDVGASTGGFTQVMLRAGAAQVLAVDAGHGQLHESLRKDPRVTNLEKTDWKRLSLGTAVAAGPFDFFTVDVSFVAARNMLRGLAFRLRPGAVGVVLIKPQFELADHLVKGGDVRDERLRRLAVEKFSAKADGLGFEVRAVVDSPVAGGEGTVELLAHIVFRGRGDALPAAPGAALAEAETEVHVDDDRPRPRPAAQVRLSPSVARRRAPRQVQLGLDDPRSWFAIAAPGTEDLVAAELGGVVEAEAIAAVTGGVEWRGPLRTGLAANLALRIPTRILLRLGELRAREFGKLRHGLARLPWEQFLAPGAAIEVSASASRSRLYHTGAIEETLRAGIGDRLGQAPPPPAKGEPGEPGEPREPREPGEQRLQRIFVRGIEDVWTLSVDTSGARLHQRGWRTAGGEAPIRETLAAALLVFSGWRPGEPLLDPMCGAGTLPIEAATVALGRLPGIAREFAFAAWPGFGDQARDQWEAMRAAARARERTTLEAPIAASDRDAAAIALTRLNAERAGVGDLIQIAERSLDDLEAPPGSEASGVLVANPPYGGRLGRRSDLPRLYGQIGQVLRTRLRGWRATVVVPDARLASAFRTPVEATRTLSHGGLRVTLVRLAAHR
jgi:putative N6-adenine-specific DNA methylase